MNLYIINRSDRPERLRHAREELRKQNLNAHLFEAIIDKPGWRGCRDSHLQLLEKNKKEVAWMCLEDDALFLGDFHSSVEQAIRELPPDWDLLSLGCSPQEPFKRYSEHLFEMGKAWCTQALIWRNREGGAVEHILKNRERINKIDVFFVEEVYKQFNCFVIFPLLVTQLQFPSDTCLRSDVSTIVKQFNKFCI
jgi:hypothetical protein